MSILLIAALVGLAGSEPAATRGQKAATPFQTSATVEELSGKQAVVETSMGTFVIELLPALAPNHVAYFIQLATEGAYDGTTFHRAVNYGIIQGGDPLSTDPAKRDQYGTGGLGRLAAEFSDEAMSRGVVAAVLQPGRPDSAGSQFFVVVTDQPALRGQYTIFGRVVEGMEVVQEISAAPLDEDGRVRDRIEMTRVTIRETPPPEPVPFAEAPVDELARYRAVLETSKGSITIAVEPRKAPNHVRTFLRLAAAGVYDGTSFHRVVPGFVIQTGMVSTRETPLTQSQSKYVGTLQPEFNDLPHVDGTVSMARLDDPASASTSFFICTAPAPSLDGNYTAFGRVVDGLDVVHAIESVPIDGETPIERIELRKVTVERTP
jgi:cyclophilin family peptidyl-prolyl cis-trans isomerase